MSVPVLRFTILLSLLCPRFFCSSFRSPRSPCPPSPQTSLHLFSLRYPISALVVQVLGRGRIIECSVCGNKWFQTAERALTLTENFLMKVWQRHWRTGKGGLREDRGTLNPRMLHFMAVDLACKQASMHTCEIC